MNSIDVLILQADRALRTVTGATRANRDVPASTAGAMLEEDERRHAAGLMRVNHVGEVCAQALYSAQALATPRQELRAGFEKAAAEESDHLAWTAQRLEELQSRPSLLNPLWYAGAFALGWVAGKAGDAISLGFVAETERQVEQHLDSHLGKLPDGDTRSRAIVVQMRDDEIRHREDAEARGAVALPAPVRGAMRLAAKVMTTTAYWI